MIGTFAKNGPTWENQKITRSALGKQEKEQKRLVTHRSPCFCPLNKVSHQRKLHVFEQRTNGSCDLDLIPRISILASNLRIPRMERGFSVFPSNQPGKGTFTRHNLHLFCMGNIPSRPCPSPSSCLSSSSSFSSHPFSSSPCHVQRSVKTRRLFLARW